MKRALYIVLLAFLTPAFVGAGSASYTSPGTYTFTVPAYGSLTVQVWGAGGAGGSVLQFASGGAGGYSLFGSVIGYGGGGGAGAAGAGSYAGAAGGSGGGASGGSTNIGGAPGSRGPSESYYSASCPGPSGAGGASPYGGAGGAGVSMTNRGGAGTAPGGGGGGGSGATMYSWPEGGGNYYECGYGGGGGGGGYAARTYALGTLTPGQQITVTVGAAGAPWLYNGQPISGGGGAGAPGRVSITWTNPPAASCSVSVSPNPINRGAGSTLSWSTSNADQWVYINNVGYVGTSGSTYVAPSSTTDYSCYAQGTGGSDGWHTASLAVYQSCALPWGGSIAHGQSVTAYQTDTVSYGQSCVSQSRTCANGTLSGSYTYQSCAVQTAASCTLNGVTVAHGSSQTFYSQQTAPVGQLCSSVSQSRTCNNGTFSGSASYQYASCTCAPIYSCSGNNVTYTSNTCTTTTVATCTSPYFCSSGVSSCVSPDPTFNVDSGHTGHLQVLPQILPSGTTARVYWNVSNVQSCAVTGTNGDSWTGLSSGSAGKVTAPIMQTTVYTMHCVALSGASPASFDETQTINVLPIFQEL